MVKVRDHNRYEVEKVGESEGPKATTTAVDYMKPFSDTNCYEEMTSDEEDKEGSNQLE